MLNRLISLVFLLSFLNFGPVYSETNFLLPQKKPSIFKKTPQQVQKDINKNLPLPKPRFETTKEVQPKQEEKVQKPGEKKDKEDIKNLDKKEVSLSKKADNKSLYAALREDDIVRALKNELDISHYAKT